MEDFELCKIAEIQLVYTTKVKPSLRPKVSSSHDAFSILKGVWDASKIEFVEQFKILLLNRANKVLGVYEVSTGGKDLTRKMRDGDKVLEIEVLDHIIVTCESYYSFADEGLL